jgi:lipoprotein-releasing system permease protein
MVYLIGLRYFLKASDRVKIIIRLSILSLSLCIGFGIFLSEIGQGCCDSILKKALDIHGHAIVNSKSEYKSKLIEKSMLSVRLNGIISSLNHGLMIRAMKKDDIRKLLGSYAVEYKPSNKKNFIWIGSGIASLYGFELGENIEISFMLDNDLITKKFKIIGIFSFGLDDLDKNIVFLPDTIVADFNQRAERIIFLRDPNKIDNYKKELESKNVYVETWKTLFANLKKIFQISDNTITIFLYIFAFAGALQSASIIFALMIDKANDIRIFNILGITRLQKVKILFTYGLLIGILTTLLGVIFGLIITFGYNKIVDMLKNNLSFIKNEYLKQIFLTPINIKNFLLVPLFSFFMVSLNIGVSVIFLVYKERNIG